MNRKQLTKSSLFLLLLLSLIIGGVYRANKLDNPLLRGETMGTSYSIRLCGNYNKKDCQLLADEINDLFLEINQQMSTWIKESQISLFNNNLSTNPIFVSENFYKAKNVKYYGNIKFCSNIQNSNKINDHQFDKIKNKKVWCAVSTHDTEELFCSERG